MNHFSNLDLPQPLQRALTEMGYASLTPIQAEALPVLLKKKTDFLGMAATGTGKTAAYGIPLLASLNVNETKTKALVLCPTRELAKQIADSINQMGKYIGPRVLPIYGGAGYGDQIYGLKRGAHIVIATPGRLVDHLERGTLSLSDVDHVILDEADEMISMGFKDDLEKILKATHKGDQARACNTWMFSATMQPELRRVADRYMHNPVCVQINRSEMLSGTVEQFYYTLHEQDKPEAICRLLDVSDDFHGLIFCQTKALVDDLTHYLRSHGYAVDQLHGDKSQTDREQTLQRFRKRTVKVLVCTDVAARGLDVKDLSHVVNYSLPRELDSYVHRIGRTGRSGVKGVAISLVTPSHFGLIGRIENMTGSQMIHAHVPTAKEVSARKQRRLLHNLEGVALTGKTDALLADEWQEFLESKSKEEIAARFLALAFPDALGHHGKDIGINMQERRRSNSEARAGASRHRGSERRGRPHQTRDGRRDERRGERRDGHRPRSAASGGGRYRPGKRRDRSEAANAHH